MQEKRKYPRYECKIRAEFDYYEGDPDKINVETAIPEKGKGVILDISMGGVFLVSNSRVPISAPVIVHFSTNKAKHDIKGTIIRTGLLRNNPTEVARKFASQKVKGDAYMAIEFENAIASLDEHDIRER